MRCWNGGTQLYGETHVGEVHGPAAVRIGTPPGYGTGYAAFWRNGFDYSLMAGGDGNTYVNAAAADGTVRLRTGNQDRLVVGPTGVTVHGTLINSDGRRYAYVVVSAANPGDASVYPEGTIWLKVNP